MDDCIIETDEFYDGADGMGQLIPKYHKKNARSENCFCCCLKFYIQRPSLYFVRLY